MPNHKHKPSSTLTATTTVNPNPTWWVGLKPSELGRILRSGTVPASVVGRKRYFKKGEKETVRNYYEEQSRLLFRRSFYGA